jgi:hypothetical protein
MREYPAFLAKAIVKLSRGWSQQKRLRQESLPFTGKQIFLRFFFLFLSIGLIFSRAKPGPVSPRSGPDRHSFC